MIDIIYSLIFSNYGRKKKILSSNFRFIINHNFCCYKFWFLNTNNFVGNYQKYKITELIIFNIVLSLPIYFYTGQYKGIHRFIGSTVIYRSTIRNFVIITFLFLITNISNILKVNIKLWIPNICFPNYSYDINKIFI